MPTQLLLRCHRFNLLDIRKKGRECFIALTEIVNYILYIPRKARLSVPGAVHHVMSRGIEGKDIFTDNEVRTHFLYLLTEGIAQVGYSCYAWSLMNTHYHLLLRINHHPLSALMRKLNSEYARWFRNKYKGRGCLFQDRYKSIVTQDQDYKINLL